MRAGGHRPAIATNIHRTVRHGGTAAPARPANARALQQVRFGQGSSARRRPARTHKLPRQGILDKYDHAVMRLRLSPSASTQFEELAGNKGIYKWFGHSRSSRLTFYRSRNVIIFLTSRPRPPEKSPSAFEAGRAKGVRHVQRAGQQRHALHAAGICGRIAYFRVFSASLWRRLFIVSKKAITCTTKRRRLPGLLPFRPTRIRSESNGFSSIRRRALLSVSCCDGLASQPFCTPTAWSSSPPAAR